MHVFFLDFFFLDFLKADETDSPFGQSLSFQKEKVMYFSLEMMKLDLVTRNHMYFSRDKTGST